MTRVPVGDALERVAGTDERRFIEVAADKLEGDGTAVRGEAGGKRDGRASGHVERTGEAQQSGDQRGVLAERAILASVGAAKAWAGTAIRSTDSNSSRTAPRNASRRSTIF